MHKNNLSHFSPKFAKMIDYVTTIEGKSFIFTNKVKLTGLHLISNILKANGLIQYKEQPNQNTLCYKCKKQLLKHTDTNH